MLAENRFHVLESDVFSHEGLLQTPLHVDGILHIFLPVLLEVRLQTLGSLLQTLLFHADLLLDVSFHVEIGRDVTLREHPEPCSGLQHQGLGVQRVQDFEGEVPQAQYGEELSSVGLDPAVTWTVVYSGPEHDD